MKWDRGNLKSKLIVSVLYEELMSADEIKARLESKKKISTKKSKPYPLTTVTMQKNISKFLKIGSDEIMNIAEKLYQRGFISYPRTETDVFQGEINPLDLLRKLGQCQAAQEVITAYSPPHQGKSNDQAHPPIHPIKYL